MIASRTDVKPRRCTVAPHPEIERARTWRFLRPGSLPLILCTGIGLLPLRVQAQSDSSPAYLRDRGTGMPTSMFGTYVRRGELLFYPFLEYYRDHNLEYKPSDLGYGLSQDFQGRFRASEGLLFFAYGFTDWLSAEMEAAVITATLYTAANDPSGAPARIHESGLGDVEGQVRARWVKESERRPEVFSYFEAVVPHHRDKVLIGTPDWEFAFGTGVTRGFSWGTLTLRAAAAYSKESGTFDLGEYAVEYLKRVSPAWRVYLGVEGAQDEVSLITEAQWHISRSVFLRINNGFGLAPKATDWSPEVGIVFSLGGTTR